MKLDGTVCWLVSMVVLSKEERSADFVGVWLSSCHHVMMNVFAPGLIVRVMVVVFSLIACCHYITIT